MLGLLFIHREQNLTVGNSVVAVHGLSADPVTTWADKSEKNEQPNWLERQLVDIIPEARVWTFGYDSTWFGDGKVNGSLYLAATRLLDAMKVKKVSSRSCPSRTGLRVTSSNIAGPLRHPLNFCGAQLRWSRGPESRVSHMRIYIVAKYLKRSISLKILLTRGLITMEMPSVYSSSPTPYFSLELLLVGYMNGLRRTCPNLSKNSTSRSTKIY